MANEINTITYTDANILDRLGRVELALTQLTQEISQLSGRVELVMRTNSRIISKLDPAFLEDPKDPEVQRRSKLLGDSVLEKLKNEALSQAQGDPERTSQLRRYFRNIP